MLASNVGIYMWCFNSSIAYLSDNNCLVEDSQHAGHNTVKAGFAGDLGSL